MKRLVSTNGIGHGRRTGKFPGKTVIQGEITVGNLARNRQLDFIGNEADLSNALTGDIGRMRSKDILPALRMVAWNRLPAEITVSSAEGTVRMNKDEIRENIIVIAKEIGMGNGEVRELIDLIRREDNLRNAGILVEELRKMRGGDIVPALRKAIWNGLPSRITISIAEEAIGMKEREVRDLVKEVLDGAGGNNERVYGYAKDWGFGKQMLQCRRNGIRALVRAQRPDPRGVYWGLRTHGDSGKFIMDIEFAEVVSAIVEHEVLDTKGRAEMISGLMGITDVKKEIGGASLDFIFERAKSLWPGCNKEELEAVKTAVLMEMPEK